MSGSALLEEFFFLEPPTGSRWGSLVWSHASPIFSDRWVLSLIPFGQPILGIFLFLDTHPWCNRGSS